MFVSALEGPSLRQRFSDCGSKFDLETVLNIGAKLIKLMRNFHDAGIVHRDISPGNIVTGRKWTKTEHDLFFVDFGKAYWYIKDGVHISPKHYPDGINLFGDPYFMSINVHKGYEASRRDDLESLAYLLIYLLGGPRPFLTQGWKEKEKKTLKEAQTSKESHFRKEVYDFLCRRKKDMVSMKKRCESKPRVFVELITYARSLEFDERPDYEIIISMFATCIRQHCQLKADHRLVRPTANYCWNNYEQEHDYQSLREMKDFKYERQNIVYLERNQKVDEMLLSETEDDEDL